jgi:RNA polymerase sigma-70 factor (ECF subfamily)
VRILKRNASEDLALVQRCKQELPHQHKAFEQLVGAYKDMIYTLCYRMTGNPSDAEDLLQEILLKLFLGLEKFEGRSAFSSWLYRIAYNHCLNFLASRKLEKRTTDPLPEGDLFRDPATERTRGDERTQAVLASLPADERSLLIMRYVMDLDVKEISAVLGIGLSATKMRLLRVRAAFQERFEETQ